MGEKTLDLRSMPEGHLLGVALVPAQALRSGDTLRILTAGDPAVMLEGLRLHLRDGVRWQVDAVADGFVALLRPAEDVEASDIVDALVRHHKILDETFARALHLVNAGEVEAARQPTLAFVDGLKRHIGVENELLVAYFTGLGMPADFEPLQTMLREHEEILGQAGVIAESYAEGTPEAWEVSPFFGILSGTLAKHEFREESNLFPHWRMQLARADAASAGEMFRRIRDELGV